MQGDVKNEKLARVLDYLKQHNAASGDAVCEIARYRGLVFYAENVSCVLTAWVWTEADLAKWYDAAAREMIRRGASFDVAMQETWPLGREDGEEVEVEEKAAA